MVTPLAVAATPPEVPWDTATLREWVKPGTRTTLLATPTGDEGASTLYQNSIDVRWAVSEQLRPTHPTHNEPHRRPSQSQDRPLQRVMGVRCHLLTTDDEGAVDWHEGAHGGGGGGTSGGEGGPVRTSAFLLLLFLIVCADRPNGLVRGGEVVVRGEEGECG